MTTDRSLRLTRQASRGLSTDGVKQVIMGFRTHRYAAVDPEWTPKPGMLYTQVRAISARINQNYDAWPSEELKKSYRTFLGKPVFVNHANEDPEKARGKVIAARYVEAGDDKYVEVIQEIDAQRFPKLAREIREGGLDSVSMGVEAGLTKCSYCGNTATDEPEFCEHVRHHKGEYLPRKNTKTGKTEDVLVYENCYKLGFFELSYVFEPADESALVSRVLVASQRRAKDTPEPRPDTSWMGNLTKSQLADMIGYPGEDTPEQRRTEREIRKGSTGSRSSDAYEEPDDYELEWLRKNYDEGPEAWDEKYNPKDWNPRRKSHRRRVANKNNALIVVDAQNDFINGSLPVPGGDVAAHRIGAALRGEHPHLDHNNYGQVIATQDYHIDPGDHFSDDPNYTDTWPVHCKSGTEGCELHPALQGGRIDHIFHKGHYSPSYSGFEGQHSQTGVGLADHLNQSGVKNLDICGIATDHCVKATALDAVKNGFNTRVILPFTAAVNSQSLHDAMHEMREAGVQFVGGRPAMPGQKLAQVARRRYAYGEIEAPEDIDTLRDEDGESFEDYQFVEPIHHEDSRDQDDDDDNPFQHNLESPEELRAPDLGATRRLDREQESEGLDTDRRVEDVEGVRPNDEAAMAQQQGRQAMARTSRRRRYANDDAALIEQAVQELEQYEAEQQGGGDDSGYPEDEGYGDEGDFDGDGYSDGEDADDDEDGYPEDEDGYDDDGDGSDEDYSDDGGEVYGGDGSDELDPRYDDESAEQRMARKRYLASCRQRRVRPTNAGYRRFLATVGRRSSAGNRRGKGNAMGSLAGRGRVAARGRMRHFADDSGHVDGGPYGNDTTQGVLEDVYISQVPAPDSDDLPTTGDGTISNTENTLVARRMQKKIKAKAADLQRELRAYRKFAEECCDDNIIEPTEVNPDFSGTDDQEYKGDFDSVQPDAVPTQPKDASVHVFRSFDNWLRSTTGRTARQHGNANFIRRQAASYAKAANIPLDRMFPTLDLVLRQARKTETDRRAAMKRRADEKLELAAPQERIDVETPVSDVTDADAQASQYDLGDYGNNAGDDIADPDLDTSSQIWAPGEGESGTKSANRKADAVAAVRYAEAYINAGLPHRDKWQLVAQAQTMRHATVVDRTRVLEAVVSSNSQRARSRKVAAAVSRGTANGLPRGLTTPRTASTQRTAANDPSNDIGIWL